MSDQSGGHGWWLASDGRWYPPAVSSEAVPPPPQSLPPPPHPTHQSQGVGWWLASDGKWYPPESYPPAPPVAQAWAAAPATVSNTSPIPGLGHNGLTWTCGGAPLSSPGRRLGAYSLDVLLLFVTLFVGWMIWSLVLWAQGQSPGKQLLGLRCVRTDSGRAAGWGTMCLREVVGRWLLASITYGVTSLVSCFMILGQTRQGIWDKIATTIVVDDKDGITRR